MGNSGSRCLNRKRLGTAGRCPPCGRGFASSDPAFVSATDLHLTATSPAIDMADGCMAPELDKDEEPRFNLPDAGNIYVCPSSSCDEADAGPGPCVEYADMGAFEYQV